MNLPYRLAMLVPKGHHDCGAHDWYNADGIEDECYHCDVGRRPHVDR